MSDSRSVIIERDLAFPPAKVWRALTTPHLIAEWLMQNDFVAVPGHSFKLSADWGSVDCKVKAIEPDRMLSYSWDAMGLESTVTWTLTPAGSGTRLRMEQEGFRADQEQAFRGAQMGWTNFLRKLEEVLAKGE